MKKKHFKAVELKYLDSETILKIREWRNQDFVKKNMYSQHEITQEEHLKYIDNIRNDNNRGLFVFYLDDEPFGVYQYTMNPDDKTITGGNYLVDEEYMFMGYGTIQTYFMGVIKFDYLKCEREYDETLDINKRVINLAQKMGGRVKKIPGKRCMLQDGYHDVYCIEGNAIDWENRRKKLEKVVYKIVEQQFDIIL